MVPKIDLVNGLKTLIVNDEPFAVIGAQCDIWRSTRQDEKVDSFLTSYKEMNANTVGFGILWSKIETEKDIYNFSFLDWFIKKCKQSGLKAILMLFNSNVCGTCQVIDNGVIYPRFTADYILKNPEDYTRICLNADIEYDYCGPPMCPNDPDTLNRETLYLEQIAQHLKSTDTENTVIMLQINNEYFYQRWLNCSERKQTDVRCSCKYCEEKYNPDEYKSGEEFMYKSFAEYTAVLSHSVKAIFPLPLYVNSPWWAPYIIEMFLEICPDIDFVGIDGISDPNEPNQLSVGQLSRNITFAAESPTEAPTTKPYLAALPYYAIFKMNGLGMLLWEAPEPHTVVYDDEAALRFTKALYPIKNALVPVLEARGSDRLIVWYSQSIESEVNYRIDILGNIIELDQPRSLRNRGNVLIQGRDVKIVEDGDFTIAFSLISLKISASQAGFFLVDERGDYLVGTPGAEIEFLFNAPRIMESGIYNSRSWEKEAEALIQGKNLSLSGLYFLRH